MCSGYSVFKSRKALLLDYIPPRMPHREREFEQLKSAFKPVLLEGINLKIHIHGGMGSGKTALCRNLGQYLEKEAAKTGKKLKYTHINLAYTPKPYHVMTKLMEEVSFIESSRSGLSPEEMLSTVARSLAKENYQLILTLDEVDTYVGEGRDPSILYMLPRIHELNPEAACRLSLIYVSRSLDWMNKLNEATLSTLGRVSAVHLASYGLPEINDIVAYRVEEAFKSGAISEDVIDFIARTAIGHGGVRYALELLLEAGGQAEIGHAQVVNAEHVRRANFQIPKGVNGAYYPCELSLHKQLLLKAITKLFESTIEPYISLEEVYPLYQVTCKEFERDYEDKAKIQTYLKDLELTGYILRVKVNGRTLVGMEFPPDRLDKALNESLKQALNSS